VAVSQRCGEVLGYNDTRLVVKEARLKALDIYTLLFMTAFICFGMSIILFSVHHTFKSVVKGMNYWAWGQLSMLLALPFLAVRGTLTELIVVPVYNGALLLGLGLALLGTQRFYHRPVTWRRLLVVWTAAIAGLLWWLVVTPSFSARVAVFSTAEVLIHVTQILVIWRYGERHFSAFFLMMLLAIQTGLTVIRGVVALTVGDSGANLQSATALATGYLATSNILIQLLSVAFVMLASRQLKQALELRATQDPLTGVLNRRGCAEFYQQLQAHGRQSDVPFTLLAIDLDHFKAVNDKHGHGIGDKVLVHIAQQISRSLRDCDRVARFGGEEFVVLLPGTTTPEATVVAARIQAMLREARTELPRCTLSIGIATNMALSDDLDQLLARADAALYGAKREGRDRVEVALQVS